MEHIFLIGVLQRCGSNYLKNLLLSHKDIENSKLDVEDFILVNAHHMNRFVKDLGDKWKYNWYGPNKNKFKKEILRNLGSGLLNFLDVNNSTSKYLLSKTPQTNNLFMFTRLFPDSKLILILRDGKSVIQSGYKSKFWNYAQGIRKWKESAIRINEFMESNSFDPKKHIFIKYEDLVNDPQDVLTKLFYILGLPYDSYNFDDEILKSKIVFGSSDYKTRADNFKWAITTQKKDFNPLSRGQNMPDKITLKFEDECEEINLKFARINSFHGMS